MLNMQTVTSKLQKKHAPQRASRGGGGQGGEFRGMCLGAYGSHGTPVNVTGYKTVFSHSRRTDKSSISNTGDYKLIISHQDAVSSAAGNKKVLSIE